MKALILFLFLFVPATTVLSDQLDNEYLGALSQMKEKNYVDAIKSFQEMKGSSFQTRQPLILYFLGKCLRSENKVQPNPKNLLDAQKALSEYLKLIGQDSPDFIDGLINLGYVYLDQGNYGEGIAALAPFAEKAGVLKGDMDLCLAYLWNGKGLGQFRKFDYQNAAASFRTSFALKKYPLFGNNFLNALLALPSTKCEELRKVLNTVKNLTEWKGNEKYLRTQAAVNSSCK